MFKQKTAYEMVAGLTVRPPVLELTLVTREALSGQIVDSAGVPVPSRRDMLVRDPFNPAAGSTPHPPDPSYLYPNVTLGRVPADARTALVSRPTESYEEDQSTVPAGPALSVATLRVTRPACDRVNVCPNVRDPAVQV